MHQNVLARILQAACQLAQLCKLSGLASSFSMCFTYDSLAQCSIAALWQLHMAVSLLHLAIIMS